MMNTLDALRACALFQDLDAADLGCLAQITVRRSYAKGQRIFSDGEEAAGFYAVVSGAVRLYKVSPEGREQELHRFGPGQAFAQAAALSMGTYPAHARVTSPATLLFFPKERFARLLADNPQMAINMIAGLSHLLEEFNTMIEDLSLREVAGRFARHLLELARQQGRTDGAAGASVRLKGSKSDLAARLGTVSETLSRTLAKLKNQGVIEVERNTITIRDSDALDEYASGLR